MDCNFTFFKTQVGAARILVKEVAMTMTPEQKVAVDQAGDAPVVVEDPETHESYVIVKEETYRRLTQAVEVESIDPSFFEYGEFIPVSNRSRSARSKSTAG